MTIILLFSFSFFLFHFILAYLILYHPAPPLKDSGNTKATKTKNYDEKKQNRTAHSHRQGDARFSQLKQKLLQICYLLLLSFLPSFLPSFILSIVMFCLFVWLFVYEFLFFCLVCKCCELCISPGRYRLIFLMWRELKWVWFPPTHPSPASAMNSLTHWWVQSSSEWAAEVTSWAQVPHTRKEGRKIARRKEWMGAKLVEDEGKTTRNACLLATQLPKKTKTWH